MTRGKSIIEQLWNELDRATKAIMDTRPRFKADQLSRDELDDYIKLQGVATGLAQAIQLMSVPHFESVQAVSSWSLKRYKMAHDGAEFMDTPGCKGYNPMPLSTRETKKESAPKSPPRGPKADPKTGKFRVFHEEEREHLKKMLSQGIPEGAIQSMLKITDEQFEAEKAKLVDVWEGFV